MTDTTNTPATEEQLPRRSFFRAFLAVIVGGIVSVVPAICGVLFFLDPLLRKNKAKNGDEGGGDDGFIKLDVTVDNLPENGVPMKVTVYDDRVDAWNMFPHQQVGAVYLRKTESDTAEASVTAFNVTCPHLGCAVDYRAADNDYYCPCHKSSFNVEGERQNPIPPRPMDSLEVKVGDDNVVWVKYQDFRGGTSEKVPV